MGEKDWHINDKETLAVWLGLSTFARDLTNCQILCRINNTTVVAYLNHQGGMQNYDCDRIAREIWKFAQERQLWLKAVHLAGVGNTEADHESRVKANIERELPQDVFDKIPGELGPFDIDVFASRTAHKLSRFIGGLPDPFAENVDAFSVSWRVTHFYAFPPFRLILKVMWKVKVEKARGVIITPMWKAQPWYPRPQKMAEMTRLGKVRLNSNRRNILEPRACCMEDFTCS